MQKYGYFGVVDNKEIEIIRIGNFLSFLKKTKYLHAWSLKSGKRKVEWTPFPNLCTFLMIQGAITHTQLKDDGMSKY